MRICRVSQTYPTKQNEGKGLHAYHISNLIKESTLVITKYYDEDYYKPDKHVQLKRIKYFQYPFPSGRGGNRLKGALAVISYVAGQLELTIKSIGCLFRFRPDIVHLQSPHCFLVGLVSKILFGSKVVVTFHGSDLRRVHNNRIYMKMLSFCSAYFYVAFDMEERLRKYYPADRLIFTPSGVDTEYYRNPLRLTEREEVLLAVGNIRWQKDYSTLVRAFGIVRRKHPQYELVIVGGHSEDTEVRKVKALIEEMNLTDSIRLVGYKNRDDTRDYLCRARLMVMSSITEGMPKVIQEAMSCKLPVVATDVGACRMLIGNDEYLVKPGDHGALADAIMRLLDDDARYSKYVADISKNARIYSWRDNAERIYRVYSGVLGEDGGLSVEHLR